jgi:hypothetical protein
MNRAGIISNFSFSAYKRWGWRGRVARAFLGLAWALGTDDAQA